MATSRGRRSLFWRVYFATVSIMLVGAGAWAIARGAQDAIGGETVLRSTAGSVLWGIVLFGIAFVVSMVVYGTLLPYYKLVSRGDQPGDKQT